MYNILCDIFSYDFERMSNSLPRVKRLTDFNEPIPEAYFPKLDSLVASRVWAPRHSGATMKVNYIIFYNFDLYDFYLNLFVQIFLGLLHNFFSYYFSPLFAILFSYIKMLFS
jgi:hypothetical protein